MQLPVRSVPLLEAVFPRSSMTRDIARDVFFILAFSFVTAGFARISILLPGNPVPITGQTFAVLLTGAVLGSRRGALAMVAYLVEGSGGLPVFAGGGSGLFWNMASGGYLIGYVPAAFLVGFLTENGWNKGTWVLLAMLAGNIVLYIPGLIQLAFWVGWDDTLSLGLYPFIPGDLAKLYVASLVLPSAWAMVNLRRGSGWK